MTISISHYPHNRQAPHHQMVTAQFEKQPPENMRKSNFFNFIISMYDSSQHPVEVHRAVFKDFYDTTAVSGEGENCHNLKSNGFKNLPVV